MNSTKSISYHVFLFPFICKDKKVFVEKSILQTGTWEQLQQPCESETLTYNLSKYFYPHVYSAITNPKSHNNDQSDGIVSNWSYILGKNNHYVIETKDKSYVLDIESIQLNLYNTQVGVLFFFLNNSKYHEEEDILKINDYGRRIYPHYLSADNSSISSLAKSITLTFDDKEIHEAFDKTDFLNQPFGISKTILDLFGENLTTKEDKKNQHIIEPIIDDRMFVLTWWGNDEKSKSLKDAFEKNSEFWHKFVFIDGDFNTCQNDDMLKDLLSEHSYNRWTKWGTFFGITRYSLALLTKPPQSDPFSLVIRNHMKTLYTQMVCLSLVQRASILKFSQDISNLCLLEDRVGMCNRLLNPSSIQKIHREYMGFVNQLYFREVTAQEQGIEMYRMLINSMGIERDVKRLGDEIDGLYQYHRLEEERKTNQSLHLLTIIAAIFLPPTLFLSLFNMLHPVQIHVSLLAGFVIFPIILSLITFCANGDVCKKESIHKKTHQWIFFIFLSYIIIFLLLF